MVAKRQKNCGNCQGFVKVTGHNWGNSGLCETTDHRTDEDCGHQCKNHKFIRFVRVKEKQNFAKLTKLDHEVDSE